MEWIKNKQPQKKYLVITSINGNKCYFEASDPQILSSLGYVDDYGTVQPPYTICSDISSFNTVSKVKDKSNEITSIKDYAFCECSKLSSINCPEVKSIGTQTFSWCSNLSSINCPEVKSIGDCAFYNCSKLSSINCPQVQSIGEYAFRNCSKLSSINCPQVQSIGEYAFYFCSNISSVILSDMIEDKITTLGGTNVFGNKRVWPISVYVPEGLQDKILEDDTWAALTADNTITLIGVQK